MSTRWSSKARVRIHRVTAALAGVLGLLAVVACSGSGPRPTAALAQPTTTRCHPAAADDHVVAVPVPGVASDWTLTSFDGTQIHVHWFPLAQTPGDHATVLMGPGWGQAGDTQTTSLGLFGTLTIKSLQDAGYNVLTWDPRGFGRSTGRAEVDSAAAEGRDVQDIITWVANQPGVQLEAPGDPRVGMVGVSYGGGMQLITAAIDCRVDAIVPSWAWHSLTTSLYKADTVKTGWSNVLYAAASGRQLDPHISHSYHAGSTSGVLDSEDVTWFAQRGPGDLVGQIRVPTLFVQGTVDTLFTLDEVVTNYRILRSHEVPTAMIWFCGGHGACLTTPGRQQQVAAETLGWLARYLKRDPRAPDISGFEFVDQDGARYLSDDYPVVAGQPIVAVGQGTLPLTAASVAGPARPRAGATDILTSVTLPFTPAKATNAVNIDVDVGSRATVVVGAPILRLSYRGTTPVGDRPTRVFAQLVDEATGLVLGNQITPIDVTLDDQTHTTSIPLEIVAWTARPGSHLTLQLVATTPAYAQPRLGGTIDFGRVDLTLPVAANLTPR